MILCVESKKNSEFKETEHTTVITRENEMLLKGYELPVLSS